MLVIGSNAGLIGMSKEHLSVALALNVPIICVVTKTDMTPPLIQAQTRKQLVKILKSPGCRKTPVYVRDMGMAVELARHMTKKGERLAPIFEVSNVEGQGLEQCVRDLLADVSDAGAGSRLS
jgi:GTPase